MSDKYDRAIEVLTREVEETGGTSAIYDAWNNAGSSQHDATNREYGAKVCDLFAPVCIDQKTSSAGCLTQLKAHDLGHGENDYDFECSAETYADLMADDRITADASTITIEDLPVFAEWQRRLDRELGR